jgi:acetyl esterase
MTASNKTLASPAIPSGVADQQARLDPEMAAVLETLRAANAGKPAYDTLTPEQYRARLAADRAVSPNPVAVARVEDIRVPVGHGRDVTVRLYSNAKDSSPQPVLVYLHGGGWVGGSLETHDHVARQLALASGVLIASVDYPLAPENPFPEAPRQIVEVVRWLAKHGATIGVDGNRIAIGGDSAGGNLAMATLLALRDAGESLIRYGVLLYACYSARELPSHQLLGHGKFGLGGSSLTYYWNHYLGADPARRLDPIAAPLEADLHGLPPLFILTGGLDTVSDDSRQLAARLAAAGQSFRYQEYPGLVHGFIHYYAQVGTAAKALATIGDELKSHLR